MKPIKIGIVEDERITAEDISIMLRDCGYAIGKPAMRYSEAIEMIETELPDLLLLDVNIPGKLDGIDLARTIKDIFGIPFIFLTANSDRPTLERAATIRPAAFLTKPVTKSQLYAAVELALTSVTEQQAKMPLAADPQRAPVLFVNDGKGFVKVAHEEILYAESEENYVKLHLSGGKEVMGRMTFTELIGQLNEKEFIRTHRCYVVAVRAITRLLPDEVAVQHYRVPVSRTHRAALMQAIGIR